MRVELLPAAGVTTLFLLILTVFVQPAHGFANGQTAALTIGPIDHPTNVAFDASGDLWVGTFTQGALEFMPPFSPSPTQFTLVGSASQGTTLLNGTVVAIDSVGDLWIGNQNRILEFKPPFSSGMNASLVIGQPNFRTTASLPATQYSVYPVNFAFDSSGNLWVVDGMHDRVLEFRFPFSNSMPASVVLGQPNFITDNPALSQYGGLKFAVESYGAISFDKSGDLWVSSGFWNRVLEFKPPFTNGMNASLVIGQQNFVTISRSAALNGFTGPLGVAFDPSGNLWVGDTSNNKRVLQFKPPFTNGMNASLAIGQTTLGCCAEIEGSIAFDSFGNLWVSDEPNNRVVEFLSSVVAATTSTSTTTTTSTTTPPTTTTSTTTTSTTPPTTISTTTIPPTTTSTTTTAPTIPSVTQGNTTINSSTASSSSVTYIAIGVVTVAVLAVVGFILFRRRNL